MRKGNSGTQATEKPSEENLIIGMTFVGLAIALVGSEAFSQLKGLLRKVEATARVISIDPTAFAIMVESTSGSRSARRNHERPWS